MAKASAGYLESVGWIFWLVVFVLLTGPAIYLTWQYKYGSTSWAVPVILGMALSAIGAGVVSSSINYFLQRRAKSRQRVERKRAKKRKRQ